MPMVCRLRLGGQGRVVLPWAHSNPSSSCKREEGGGGKKCVCVRERRGGGEGKSEEE